MQKLSKIIKYILNPASILFLFSRKKFENQIALNYIFNFKREFNFITIITFLSFIGITVGIAALIIVLSIFNGFRDFAEKQIMQFDPHLRIEYKSAEFDSLTKFLKNNSKVQAFSPIVQGKVILKFENSMQVSELHCIEPKYKNIVSDISSTINAGAFNIDSSEVYSIVIGAGLSERLNVLPGDTIYAISPDLIEESIKQIQFNNEIPLIVKGIFVSHSKNYDDALSLAHFSLKDLLYSKGKSELQFMDIKLKDVKSIDEFSDVIKTNFPKIITQTWYDLHSDIFNIMKLERLMVFIVMSLIILIAAFNLLSSQIMTVIEKQRDISILKAIGASDLSIKRIFTKQGLFVGLSSAIYGTVLGLGFCYAQINYKLFALNTSKYLIDAIPVSIDYWYVFAINIFALLMTYISTIKPAKISSNQNIANFIKNN